MKKLIFGLFFAVGLSLPSASAYGQQIFFEIDDATTDSIQWGSNDADKTRKIAQKYIATEDRQVCSIKFYVRRNDNTPLTNIELDVMQGGINPQNGTLSNSGTSFGGLYFQNNPGYQEIPLFTCLNMQSGQTYWFVWKTAQDSADTLISQYRPSDQYPNSSYWQFDNVTQTWVEYLDREWAFALISTNVAPTRNPVLIIPGIAGTELNNGSENIWLNLNQISNLLTPNDYFLSDNLLLNNNGDSINSISAGNVIKSVLTVNTFEGLESLLNDNDFIQNDSLFYLSYDWRLDLESSAELLREKIDNIKSQTGTEKVDIISHSMGGLLLKKYINTNGKEDLGKVFFVGTPHLGAPKAAKVLFSGDRFSIPTLEEDRIRDIAVNSPAIHQLLPSQNYFNNFTGYIFSRGLLGSTELNYQETKDFLGNKNLNTSLIQRAENFHSQGLDNLDLSGLEVYNFAGCRQATQSAYRFSLGNLFINRIGYSSGDETVPLVSANYINTSNKFYVRGGTHSELPSNEVVRNAIISILNGEDPILGGNLSNNSSFCNFRGRQLEWHSPISVHVYDQENRHSGPIEGGIENDIPGVDYEIIDGHKFIFLPTDEGQQYRVEGFGTASGSFDLVITDNDNGVESQSILFNDIPLLVDSHVTLNVSENIVNNQINFDYDNSGTFEVINASAPEFNIEFDTTQKGFRITSSDYISCNSTSCTAINEVDNSSVLKFNKLKLGNVYTLSLKSASYDGEVKDLSNNVFVITFATKNNQISNFTQTLLVKNQEVATIVYDPKTNKSTIITYKNSKLMKEIVQGIKYLQVKTNSGKIELY